MVANTGQFWGNDFLVTCRRLRRWSFSCFLLPRQCLVFALLRSFNVKHFLNALTTMPCGRPYHAACTHWAIFDAHGRLIISEGIETQSSLGNVFADSLWWPLRSSRKTFQFRSHLKSTFLWSPSLRFVDSFTSSCRVAVEFPNYGHQNFLILESGIVLHMLHCHWFGAKMSDAAEALNIRTSRKRERQKTRWNKSARMIRRKNDRFYNLLMDLDSIDFILSCHIGICGQHEVENPFKLWKLQL